MSHDSPKWAIIREPICSGGKEIQMGRRFQALAFVSALVILSTVLMAQMRVDVGLGNVVVTVTDGRGRYVPSLTQDDFTIEEDGKQQQIAHFSQDQNVPV